MKKSHVVPNGTLLDEDDNVSEDVVSDDAPSHITINSDSDEKHVLGGDNKSVEDALPNVTTLPMPAACNVDAQTVEDCDIPVASGESNVAVPLTPVEDDLLPSMSQATLDAIVAVQPHLWSSDEDDDSLMQSTVIVPGMVFYGVAAGSVES